MRKIITADLVRERLSYDPDTGIFVWKKRNEKWFDSRFAGKRAGTISSTGYEMISVNHRIIGSHRLAWLHFYGQEPSFTIDHLDRNPLNNAINNLADVPQQINNLNRNAYAKSGLKGIHKADGKWEATFSTGTERYRFGRFDTIEEAKVAQIYGIQNLQEFKPRRKSKSKSKHQDEITSHSILLSLISYDPDTGIFKNKGGKKRIGHRNKTGYRRVQLGTKRYPEHVLAVFYMTSEWPKTGHVVDHINGKKSDNRWSNLRVVSKSLNATNRSTKSGQDRGIRRKKGYKNFEVMLTVDGQRNHIGMFPTIEEAREARDAFVSNRGLTHYFR